MRTVFFIAILITIASTPIWVHRRRTPRRDRRRRQAAARQARSLVTAIMDCHEDPTAPLAAGVVLQVGEIAWTRTRARLTMHSSQHAWVAYTQMSWRGRYGRNVSREISSARWEDFGEIDWLITSHRTVGRLPASSELISVWWSGLVGLDIDLNGDRLTLNGMNGWTGKLTGPEISPIAVAAVAMCHGPEALAAHPGLAQLRHIDGRNATALSRGPLPPAGGATIVALPTRQRPCDGK